MSTLGNLRGSETAAVSVCAQLRIQDYCQDGRLISADPASKIQWYRSEERMMKLRSGNLECFRRRLTQPLLDTRIRQRKRVT
jgi:hypothetical protein